MSQEPTDEDLQIARLIVHRDLTGWIVQDLDDAGIPAERTRGNDVQGDIRLLNAGDSARAKVRLRQIHKGLHGEVVVVTPQPRDSSYIEIKAYSGTTVTSGLARQIINKATILGVVTTTTITQPAKSLLNQADIAWIDRFPEELLRQFQE